MTYYMTCDVNGCVSLELRAKTLQAAIDEGYERVKECAEGNFDLENACGISLDGLSYRDACDRLESSGAKCVSRSGITKGVDIWTR